ncbi:MAG: hypothetical protein M3Y06_00525 [Actinomycetota bacterium]|nr:hypothetical protein [Actinomycetota bacterium]
MTVGSGALVLDDEQSYADFGTFVARARSLDPAGAMRLQASGSVLAAYVGVLEGRGLLGEGTVVGLRVTTLAQPATMDRTVTLAALSDRLARAAVPGPGGSGVLLSPPPVSVSASWAAMAPPRSGWEPVGVISTSVLTSVARAGIAEIAQGTGPSAGAPAVNDLRQRVWGRPTTSDPAVVAGAAFAAYALGFLEPTGESTVASHGRWTRLSSPRGHVLVR